MRKGKIRDHFEFVAQDYDKWKKKNHYYHGTLKEFYCRYVMRGDSVVEYGCGTGDIIASVDAGYRVGLDVAEGMVDIACRKYPHIVFKQHDCETIYPERGRFDVAILADIIDHVTDILKLYASVNNSLKTGGRMCISTINPLWHPLFALAERLGLKMPEGEHNFVPKRDLVALLKLRGFRLVEGGALMLIPRKTPFADWINRIGPRLPLLHRLCVAQTVVAEKVVDYGEDFHTDKACSVVVPCCNEEDNIEECIRRIPEMGQWTEIIFVDDGSTDGTAEVVRRLQNRRERVRLVSHSPNRGKGYAVKRGFDIAEGDVLMILDADMAVMPEELPLFFRTVAEGCGYFANGTRMVYPMEDQAMRFVNLIGNFFFGAVLSWLLSQRISDTLCGTKALSRNGYSKIRMGNDKWGDFDLLFGAAENNMDIVEIPVYYKARTAGVSKMRPFRHCLVLMKMCIVGFMRLKLGIRPR